MSLKYHSNNYRNDPAKHFGSAPVFNPNIERRPQRALLRDCPIVALHWFGLKREGV